MYPHRRDDDDPLAALVRIEGAYADFVAGTHPAAGAWWPCAGGPAAATFCLVIDRKLLCAEPGLAALIHAADDDRASLGGSPRGRLGWRVWRDPEQPLARLDIDLRTPLRIRAAVLLRCTPCREYLWLAGQGGPILLVPLDDPATGVDPLGRLVAAPRWSVMLTVGQSSAVRSVVRDKGWCSP